MQEAPPPMSAHTLCLTEANRCDVPMCPVTDLLCSV